MKATTPSIVQAKGAAADAERLALGLRYGSERRSDMEDARGALEKLETVLAGLREAGANATVWSAGHHMPTLTRSQRRQAMGCYARCQRALSDLSAALSYTERMAGAPRPVPRSPNAGEDRP